MLYALGHEGHLLTAVNKPRLIYTAQPLSCAITSGLATPLGHPPILAPIQSILIGQGRLKADSPGTPPGGLPEVLRISGSEATLGSRLGAVSPLRCQRHRCCE